MKIDDIALDLVTRNASFVTSLSTTAVPLAPITAAQVFLREFQEPTGKVCVYLEPLAEENEEITPTFSIVTLQVEMTVFVQGAREATLREQAANYSRAFHNCLKANPFYFGMTARDDFEGVEGKPDIKATKITLTFKYEE